MVAKVLTDCNPLLIDIAREVCIREGVDFDKLSGHQARGLLYFWCLTCHRSYPLTDLTISKKKKICVNCGHSVKVRGSSNRFGKLRRAIFFRRLSAEISNRNGCKDHICKIREKERVL